jgi:elongation factor 3
MLEKATRVLTDEDKAMMDIPIEGKNGELRKIEVGDFAPRICQADATVHPWSTKTEEEFPVRGQIPRNGPQGV